MTESQTELVYSRWGTVRLLLITCLAVSLVVGLCRSAAAQSPPSQGFERLVDVGGHRLYVKCMGSGSPTVILEAGLGDSTDRWAHLQSEVARFTTVCSYDRANLGRSDRGSVPRTSQTTVNELRALLINAAIAGPYVLVGHSIGGFHVQLFTRQDGGRSVAGVVLVDATPIDFPEVAARFGFPAPNENPEGLDILASASELKAAPAFPNLPLVVLTHGIPFPWAPAELERAWQDLQVGQSRLSPRGELVVAECAAHYIQLDRPDLVIAAIARVSSLTAPSQPGGGGCNTPPPGSNTPPPPGSNTPPPPGAGGSNTPSHPGAAIRPDTAPPAPFADCPALAANVIRGSATSNSLVGTSLGDRIFAGTGNDLVDGGAGEDCIDLGPGADRGRGGSGADLILGGRGRDRISGSTDNDRLLGGAAADRLIGGAGEDHLSGGSASDTISARDRRRDRINCGGGRDKVIADREDRVARNCERVTRR